MLTTMKFIVRYWSSRLPDAYRKEDGAPRWVDYSLHPASKLGLHNALLAVHDRMDILRAHGGQYGCAVFVQMGERTEMLSEETATTLFMALPRGEVKWLDIQDCLLPTHPDELPSTVHNKAMPTAEQLPLFGHPHTHTPYDDLDIQPHTLNIDV